MQTINANGSKLTPKLFIELYREAKKLAPPRYLTMRLHPETYKDILILADIPESIQLGPTPGPLGKQIMRVACIRPPLGVSDGIAIQQDSEMSRGCIGFYIHGNLELQVEGLSYEMRTDSPSI